MEVCRRWKAARQLHLIDLTICFTLQPWQLYFVILAGWVSRQQQYVIEYLITANKVLRETHNKARILLTDPRHVKRSEFVYRQANGSFQFFHHTRAKQHGPRSRKS